MKRRKLALFLLLVLAASPSIAAAEGVVSKDQFTAAYEDADNAVTKNRITNSFLTLGATIGIPAGLNAHASFYLWRFVLRGSGMFFHKDLLGAQADAGFSFLNGPRLRHSVSFVGGYTKRNPLLTLNANAAETVRSASYIGATYDLFIDGFFLQTGLGYPLSGKLSSPLLIFQVGYLFYFPQ